MPKTTDTKITVDVLAAGLANIPGLGVSAFASKKDRQKAMLTELAALEAWKSKTGRKGPEPKHPAMDEIHARVPFGRKATGSHRAPSATISLARNGKTLAASWNKFSNVAYHMTKGMGSNPARMTTAEFLAYVIEKTGNTDPLHSSWTVTLASGDLIESTVIGAPVEVATSVPTPRKARTPRKATPAQSRAAA